MAVMASVDKQMDGKYKVRWREGGAKSSSHSKTFKSKREADRFAVQVEDKLASGDSTDHKGLDRSLNDWSTEWFPTVTSWQPNTAKNYRTKWAKYIEADLGRQPIKTIDRARMKQFVMTMRASGVGPGTIRKTVGLVAGTLEHAFDVAGYRDRDNPARRLRLQTADARDINPLEVDEVGRLAHAIVHPTRPGAGTRKPGLREAVKALLAEGMTQKAIAEKLGVATSTVCYHANAETPPAQTFPELGTLVKFAAYTGLRSGEIEALTPSSIRDGKVRVAYSITRHTTEVAKEFGVAVRHQKGTKTNRIRMVPIPTFVMAELEPLIAMRAPTDPLFQMPEGGPLNHTNLLNRHFKPAAIEISRPELHFHDLRHFYASLLIKQGVPVNGVAKKMGHASIITTLRNYGHLFNDFDDDVLAAIDQAVAAEVTV